MVNCPTEQEISDWMDDDYRKNPAAWGVLSEEDREIHRQKDLSLIIINDAKRMTEWI